MTKRAARLADSHRPGVMNEDPPGVAAAKAALAKRTGPPCDDDAPPSSTFPGAKARRLPGQLRLGE